MSESTVQQKFVTAWSNIKNPELDSVNPHFGNKYASLKATLDVIRAACAPLRIAYRQLLEKAEDGSRELHSFVIGDDGAILDCSYFPIETPPNPQSFGSILTYTKRQQAQVDWGITGEDDDDGEAGAKTAENAPQKPGQNKALADVKQRLWNAIKEYAASHGKDPKTIAQGVERRPDYTNTVDYLTVVAEEFESELSNAGYTA